MARGRRRQDAGVEMGSGGGEPWLARLLTYGQAPARAPPACADRGADAAAEEEEATAWVQHEFGGGGATHDIWGKEATSRMMEELLRDTAADYRKEKNSYIKGTVPYTGHRCA